MRFVQQAQGIQQLLGKYPDKGSAQSTELVLFDQLIKINAEQFECKTQMLTVDECVLETKQVMVVILVILAVELRGVSEHSDNKDWRLYHTRSNTETSIILWLK
jgi:hypothetical protein